MPMPRLQLAPDRVQAPAEPCCVLCVVGRLWRMTSASGDWSRARGQSALRWLDGASTA